MDLSLVGKTAAVASVLTATNPVEIIKLRMQTSYELFKTGKVTQNISTITECVTSMAEKEGLRSFWKGNTVGILRFFPNEFINYKARGFYQEAFVAQLGERKTEDLKVRGSIPRGGIFYSLTHPPLPPSLKSISSRNIISIHHFHTGTRTSGNPYLRSPRTLCYTGSSVTSGRQQRPTDHRSSPCLARKWSKISRNRGCRSGLLR
jgi:hypothetical protein